ncbi:hypothetical protein F5X71_29620 [Nocardia brasiliensis]|uniref:Uncharacterized protein n=1 Tax=Nocardia brasiliensis TaxID=37326 RepID=A0A6G9XYL8_NOCBR|nr:hypothetical protein [Nocardia brasiliensis]QIS05913.1 hypothetical protein F5X71_29620 [Nocardia brasiliensis]
MYKSVRLIILVTCIATVVLVAILAFASSVESECVSLATVSDHVIALPNGDVVPDLMMELPGSETVPAVPEDSPLFDCRVDGNQICGYDAFVVGPNGEPMHVPAGYYGFHYLGDIGNPDARAALGLPELNLN